MTMSCLGCAASETELVRRGFIHFAAWNMGHHLRRCPSCNRRRPTARADPIPPEWYDDSGILGRAGLTLSSARGSIWNCKPG